MYKHFILLFLLSFFSLKLNAQLAPLLSHKSKVYVSDKNGSVYWPKSLPFFVRLSTSADPNAPSFLLNELSKKAGSEYEKQELPSINLDISGNQYLRWFDVNTGDTLLFRFVSDGVSPVTALSMSAAPTYTNSQNRIYYGSGLVITVTTKDDFSGVEQTFVSLDESGYSPYFSPLSFNQEKSAVLDFYSVDHTGNVEQPKRYSFVVDLSAPQTEYSLKGLYQSPVYSTTVTIALSAKDALSGVKTMFYQLDTLKSLVYTKPIGMDNLTDGEHTITYWSEDFVKNIESKKTLKFYLDRLEPITKIAAETDVYQSKGDTYVSARTQFSLSASDNKSGVKLIEFAFDDAVKLYETPFRLPNLEGAVTIRYRAIDNMENKARFTESVFLSDITPPKSSFTFKGKQFTQRNLHWVRKETELIIQAKDNLSGVKSIFYSVNKNSSETEYKQGVRFTDDGRYEVVYASVDNVLNREANNQVTVIVDSEAPEILMNFSSTSIGSRANKKNEVLEVYPLGTNLYLAATDKSSGLSSIQYKINDGGFTNYTMPIVFEKTGEFMITVKATDNVDNPVEKIIKLMVTE